MTKHRAQCQCGQLKAAADADPDFVVACSCKACQHRTGAPFGAALYFRKDDLETSGASQTWSRKADSDRDITNHFCPACGTNLFWSLEMRPDHMGVAYGCFDTPVPEPMRVVWTEEKHDWVEFPGTWPSYEKGTPE